MPSSIKNGVGGYDISLTSPILLNNEYWQNFENLVGNYLGTNNFWLRNLPSVHIDSSIDRNKLDNRKYYHLDWGFHQLSIILILNNMTIDSTCTEVIPGTHLNPRFLYDITRRDSTGFVRYSEAKKNTNGSIKLFGDIGTTYLFDAGNALHKACFGSDNRLMLHWNFACSRSYLRSCSPEFYKNLRHFVGKKPLQLFQPNI